MIFPTISRTFIFRRERYFIGFTGVPCGIIDNRAYLIEICSHLLTCWENFEKGMQRDNENLSDFCIFDFNFYWKITNLSELNKNRPKQNFNFSRGWRGSLGPVFKIFMDLGDMVYMHHCYRNLSFPARYQRKASS